MRFRFDSVAGLPGDGDGDEFDPKNPASEMGRVPPPHLRTVCGADCQYRRELVKIRELLSPELARIESATGVKPTAYSGLLELSSRAANNADLVQEVRRLSGSVASMRGSLEMAIKAVECLEATVLREI